MVKRCFTRYLLALPLSLDGNFLCVDLLASLVGERVRLVTVHALRLPLQIVSRKKIQ